MKKLFLCSLMFCVAFTVFSQDKQERKNHKKASTIEQLNTTTETTPVVKPVSGEASENEEVIPPEDVAEITFDEESYNYGTVKSGKVVKHTFKFTNTSNVPLVIERVNSTCICIMTQYPREAIPPGERGEITIIFDTKNKSGLKTKPINIIANTWPKATSARIYGTVEKSAE